MIRRERKTERTDEDDAIREEAVYLKGIECDGEPRQLALKVSGLNKSI